MNTLYNISTAKGAKVRKGKTKKPTENRLVFFAKLCVLCGSKKGFEYV